MDTLVTKDQPLPHTDPTREPQHLNVTVKSESKYDVPKVIPVPQPDLDLTNMWNTVNPDNPGHFQPTNSNITLHPNDGTDNHSSHYAPPDTQPTNYYGAFLALQAQTEADATQLRTQILHLNSALEALRIQHSRACTQAQHLQQANAELEATIAIKDQQPFSPEQEKAMRLFFQQLMSKHSQTRTHSTTLLTNNLGHSLKSLAVVKQAISAEPFKSLPMITISSCSPLIDTLDRYLLTYRSNLHGIDEHPYFLYTLLYRTVPTCQGLIKHIQQLLAGPPVTADKAISLISVHAGQHSQGETFRARLVTMKQAYDEPFSSFFARYHRTLTYAGFRPDDHMSAMVDALNGTSRTAFTILLAENVSPTFAQVEQLVPRITRVASSMLLAGHTPTSSPSDPSHPPARSHLPSARIKTDPCCIHPNSHTMAQCQGFKVVTCAAHQGQHMATECTSPCARTGHQHVAAKCPDLARKYRTLMYHYYTRERTSSTASNPSTASHKASTLYTGPNLHDAQEVVNAISTARKTGVSLYTSDIGPDATGLQEMNDYIDEQAQLQQDYFDEQAKLIDPQDPYDPFSALQQ